MNNGDINKYEDTFKKGDIICPSCNFDMEGYEFGADMIDFQGKDCLSCPKCETDILFELTFKFKVLDIVE